MNKLNLTIVLCAMHFLCFSQKLSNDVVSTAGEEITNTNENLSLNTTVGELSTNTISNTEIILTQGFQQTLKILTLDSKANLQGAMLGSTDGLMRDDLRINNLIPITSPYNNDITTTQSVLDVTGNNAIVDWVEVELRNDDNRIIETKSALLQKDGDIVSPDGSSLIQLTTQNDEYFVSIKHRNHFGVMSASKVQLGVTNPTIDFTDSATLTLGDNSQAILSGGKLALWGGNANDDNIIRYQGSNNDIITIKDKILANINNISNSNLFQYYDYDNADINLDGRIRYQGSNNDSNVIKDIILSHPDNITSSNLFFFSRIFQN